MLASLHHHITSLSAPHHSLSPPYHHHLSTIYPPFSTTSPPPSHPILMTSSHLLCSLSHNCHPITTILTTLSPPYHHLLITSLPPYILSLAWRCSRQTGKGETQLWGHRCYLRAAGERSCYRCCRVRIELTCPVMILFDILLFFIIYLLYCTVLYCTVLCCAVLCCTALYCAALHCPPFCLLSGAKRDPYKME